ncbi:MAG: inositol monophosphatase family protein [Desulfobacterales bacterium]|nr:inositol monophosphatase family protein [Desulfobacterales bacterium]
MKNNEYVQVAIKAAKKAGSLQKKYLGKPHRVAYKGEIDIVTDVDHKCEAAIINTIRKACPEHDILAEESLERKKSNSDYRWIIDPLDGTTNYVHNFPFFCVSVALEIKGTVQVGVVYDPIRKELFSGIKNQGAFLNGHRLSVSGEVDLKKSLIATGFPYDIETVERNNLANFVKIIKASRGIRRAGSAALDLCYVACGRLDGYWELKLKPWDMAAGQLIVKEAGGQVTNFSGGKISIYHDEILASNGLIHGSLKKFLLSCN